MGYPKCAVCGRRHAPLVYLSTWQIRRTLLLNSRLVNIQQDRYLAELDAELRKRTHTP